MAPLLACGSPRAARALPEGSGWQQSLLGSNTNSQVGENTSYCIVDVEDAIQLLADDDAASLRCPRLRPLLRQVPSPPAVVLGRLRQPSPRCPPLPAQQDAPVATPGRGTHPPHRGGSTARRHTQRQPTRPKRLTLLAQQPVDLGCRSTPEPGDQPESSPHCMPLRTHRWFRPPCP
jgi:hypothetical protein